MLGKIGLGLLVAAVSRLAVYFAGMGSSMSRWTSPPKPEPTCTSSFQRNLRRSVLIFHFPAPSPGTRKREKLHDLLPTLELTATELAKLPDSVFRGSAQRRGTCVGE